MLIKLLEMCRIESLRSSVHEQLTSVGEEILCVLEEQSDLSQLKLNVRVFVSERLTAAAEMICELFQREIEALQTLLETQHSLMDSKLHRADLQVPPVCEEEVSAEQQERSHSLVQEEPASPFLKARNQKDCVPVRKEELSHEQQERSSSLVHEEPKPPRIKEEQEELVLQTPEEADGTLTLPIVKRENGENGETDPPASTSTEHMKTQADAEDCETSQPISDAQLPSSHCSESDTEDSNEWEETPSMGTHTGEKPFSCTVCGNSFSLSRDLERHVRIHTGEKPFGCKVCGSSFSLNRNLKQHMRTHTGEKPFSCTVCGNSFSETSNLKKHMMIHTGEKPFTCTVCGNSFRLKGNLKIHMRTHEGEKPFSCAFCCKRFSQTSNLKQHMRVHTGEKPFSCTVCGKSFVENRGLKNHMRNIHSNTV